MFTFLFLVALLIILCTYAAGGLSAAPWVPARKKDVARFIHLAHIKHGDRVYDLGCGDGRILEAAARVGAHATGFEISLFPFFLAHLRARRVRPGHMRVHYKNFWRADLSNADVVYIFLMTKVLVKLREKLTRELKPGTRVVSYVFRIPGWEPVVVDRLEKRAPVYVYVVPGPHAPPAVHHTHTKNPLTNAPA